MKRQTDCRCGSRSFPQLMDARITTEPDPSVTCTNGSPRCFCNRAHGLVSDMPTSGMISGTLAVSTGLRGKDRSHVDLLLMAIRWERVRAAWFSSQGNRDESEACVAREQRGTATGNLKRHASMLKSRRGSRWPDQDPSTEGCANHHCTWTVKGARHNRHDLYRDQRGREAHPPHSFRNFVAGFDL